MSKKTLIILILIIIALVIGGLFGFYFYLNQKAGGNLSFSDVTKGSFFTFNTNSSPSTGTSGVSNTSTSTPVVTTTIPRPIPRLRHLTLAPVAGSSFISKDIFATSTFTTSTSTKKVAPKLLGTEEVIRWVDRATGNIFETSSSTLETTRITNTTVPKTYEAYFIDPKGNSVIFRGLLGDSDAITTQYGTLQPLTATGTDQSINLVSLPLNITSFAVSPNSSQVFSVLPSNIRGIISKPDGTSQTNVFNSPFHEWLASWPTLSTIILNTKPSGGVPGYAYTLNTKTGAVVKIIGGIGGLTTLMSPDGTQMLFSESTQQGGIELNLFNVADGSRRDLFARTFPEKCVWSNVDTHVVYCAIPANMIYATYPDIWYQGLITFADSLWKINTSTGDATQLLQPTSIENQPLDMINLSVDAKDQYILFSNKTDLSLWSYRLTDDIATTTVATSTATSTFNVPKIKTSSSDGVNPDQ